MLMKIIGCLIIVIFFNCDGYISGVVEPTRDIKISRNVTIYRNKYGRLLGLLSFLKGFHHAKHIYHPLIMSKLWRASFEFELKPHRISANEFASYFPVTLGQSSGGSGSNNIDSVFHFGDNQQQSSITVGGSNQINRGPDERDETPTVVKQHSTNNLSDADNLVISIHPNENEEKSERVLRHVIRSRADEQSEEDENLNYPNTTPTNDEEDTVDNTSQSSTITPITESKDTVTETATNIDLPETVTKIEMPEAPTGIDLSETTAASTISSFLGNNEVSSVSIPSEWMGYYDNGVHRPEVIEEIEFTTNYPFQLDNGDVNFVKYETPFRPSLPDYSHKYYSNFFVPLRYFKR